MRRLFGWGVIACALACVVGAWPVAAEDLASEAWTLENGVRVLFIPAPDAPMTACVALVGAGSAEEKAKERSFGAAHLLEHLLFNGTGTMTQEELYAAFDDIGAYANAATRKDYTAFQVLAPREHSARAADLLAQMLFESTLPPAAFEKEKGIVLSELRGGASAAERATQVANALMLEGTPYQRDSGGTVEDIEAIDRADVLAFYEHAYVPRNVTLIVMGGGGVAAAKPWIAAAFGRGARRPVVRTVPAKPVWPAPGAWAVGPAPDSQWRLYARYPAPPPGTPGYAAAVVLAAALDRHVLRLPGLPPLEELSADVEVNRRFTHVVVQVPFHEADPTESLTAWRRAMRQLPLSIPPDLDLEPVRTHLAYQDASLRQRPHYYGFFRGPEFLVDPKPEMVEVLDAVAAVTVEDVRNAARQILTGTHAAVVLAPNAEVRWLTAPPVEPVGPPPAGETATRAPTEWTETWADGLRLQVRREAGLGVAAIHLLVEGRSAREPRGKRGIAELLHRCLLGGTATRSEADLERALTAMGATVKTHDDARIPYDNYALSPGYSYVRIEVLDEYLPDALALLADVLSHASYPEDVVRRQREQLVRDATMGQESQRRRASRLLYAHLFGADSWAAAPPLGDPKELAALSDDYLRIFHATYFSRDALRLTIVSGMPVERGRDLARACFGGGPPAAGQAAAAALVSPAAPAEIGAGTVIERPGGQDQGQLVIGQVVHVPPEDRAAATVAVAFLSERLAQVLREERGWAYAVGCDLDWEAPAPVWAASFAGPGEHLRAAQETIQEEVTQLQTTLVTAAQVRRTTNRLRGRQQMRRLSAINRAYYWAMRERSGLAGLALEAGAMERGAVTPERVRSAAQLLWQPDAWVVVRLGGDS